MLNTMHVVRFQPSGWSGAGPGCRSLAGDTSRAVTELDSERRRGVSSVTVEAAEMSSWPFRPGLALVIVSVRSLLNFWVFRLSQRRIQGGSEKKKKSRN
jgi:hypothetical protein